jgi:hypothetical protein
LSAFCAIPADLDLTRSGVEAVAELKEGHERKGLAARGDARRRRSFGRRLRERRARHAPGGGCAVAAALPVGIAVAVVHDSCSVEYRADRFPVVLVIAASAVHVGGSVLDRILRNSAGHQ